MTKYWLYYYPVPNDYDGFYDMATEEEIKDDFLTNHYSGGHLISERLLKFEEYKKEALTDDSAFVKFMDLHNE